MFRLPYTYSLLLSGWLLVGSLSTNVVLGKGFPESEPLVNATENRGAEIYAKQCASCHGPHGEGVVDKHEAPLHGDRSFDALVELIVKTMPEDDPGACVGEEARQVASYIFEEFYSPSSRQRRTRPRRELAHLTVDQHLNSLADLLSSFQRGDAAVKWPATDERGLSAEYFSSRDFDRDKRQSQKIDRQISFDFQDGSPDPALAVDEFSIRWDGSIMIHDSGIYEFVLESENGVRLFLNDLRKPWIDQWVSSGNEPRAARQSMYLLGGRSYPLRVEFFKFKEKSSSIQLRWQPPGRTEELIPRRHLVPQGTAPTFVGQTKFPPDDATAGYERGVGISRAWDDATTEIAIDVANYVFAHAETFLGVTAESPELHSRGKEFIRTLTLRAFRRPLTANEQLRYIEQHFADGVPTWEGIKRAIILCLKSPHFLYPDLSHPEHSSIPENQPQESVPPTDSSFPIAHTLALVLWDGLPDQTLWQQAEQAALSSEHDRFVQARRMVSDPRTAAKLRRFFREWMLLDDDRPVTKDGALFAGFDDMQLANLAVSLDLFLDHVIWQSTGDFRDLFTADYLFLNRSLAEFYGATTSRMDVTEQAGDQEFQPVHLPEQSRAGLLTHPYLMARLAYPRNSSPIHRGVFLTRHVFGRTLHAPPMAIEFQDAKFDPTWTMREKVTELTRPENCQTCHQTINSLGFSLEHFDAVGRYRTREHQRLVDASTSYRSSSGDEVTMQGSADLAQWVAKSPETHRAFVSQLFQFLVNQPIEAYGSKTLDGLIADFERSEFNLRELLARIAVRVSRLDPSESADGQVASRDELLPSTP